MIPEADHFLHTRTRTHTHAHAHAHAHTHTQSGQLNEYTERKEMMADVVCMSLGTVPLGEQRSRFLSVGLSDQTVRIISLDPTVSHMTCLLASHDCHVTPCRIHCSH